ncbi:MAG TPA: LpqB family beta-propeller domain-containing protein [Pyrinomonadaceae bacterium]|jgi:Tol biopolymer transport system component|nr:LpqB family beta-propeller domain-containing protein [Pyrinomonadaceae bacterium]
MRIANNIYAIVAALLLCVAAGAAPAVAQTKANGKIAFERIINGSSDIFVMNADGTGESNITETPFSESQAAWSPDGSKLVFVRAPQVAGETVDLYVMDADGHNLKRLTSDDAIERFPAWSPDGTRIAYARTEAQGGFEQIYTVTADGFELKNLTAGLRGDHSHPTWSPDAKRVAFASSSATMNGYEIWAMDSDGTRHTQLTTNEFAWSLSPAWSPDGRAIAFRRNSEIMTLDLQTGVEKNLTNSPFDEDTPEWSPDGKQLVFARFAEGNLDIYAMKADGTEQRRLTADPQMDTQPAWQPASTQVAFVSTRDGNREIYTMGEDGNGVTRLTDNAAADTAPALSPDGRRVAFVSTRDGGAMLYVMNSDGTGVARLTNPPEVFAPQDDAPAWSPDGDRLVFHSRSRDSKFQLYVVNADGTGLKKISDGASDDMHPTWSPDGTRIAFMSLRKGDQSFDIYTVKADGTGLLNLTHDDVDDTDPAWSPDGARIAYVRSCCSSAEIYVMNADGTGRSRVTDNTANERDPAWSPDSTRVVFASLRNAVNNVSTYDLYAATADGSVTARLTTGGLENVQPSWSAREAARPAAAHSIQITVLQPGEKPLAGVRLTLSGGASGSQTTDGGGFATFANLPEGGTYTVTASKDGYTFKPETRTFAGLSEDTSGSFEAFPVTKTYAVGGRVTDAKGAGLGGVTVTLAGGAQASAKTDAEGGYTFAALDAGLNYTLTPSLEGYTFDPAGHAVSDLSEALVVNFHAAAVPEPARVQFSAASLSTGEGARLVTVKVARTGEAAAEGSVFYETLDGTADERNDYTTALGTLRFAAGETEKTFDVLLTDDAYAEGREALTLKLSGATGGLQLGETAAATLFVEDDDAEAGPNPAADAEFFVRQHYHDFLNREPDADGLRHWADQLTACGGDAGCLDVVRMNVSAAFFLSIEFKETGYLVHRLQRASYGTRPRYRDFVRDAREMGRGVVVNHGDWQGQLEANKQAFVAEWAARPEFAAKYAGMSDAQFVDALWSNVGVEPAASERGGLVAGLESGALTRADALRRVAEAEGVAAAELNRAFVLMEYFGYLRRNPDDRPDEDMSGYHHWLAKLEQFGGDFRSAQMVKAFIVSREYQRRFGQ